jgi:hypothetical protein
VGKIWFETTPTSPRARGWPTRPTKSGENRAKKFRPVWSNRAKKPGKNVFSRFSQTGRNFFSRGLVKKIFFFREF